MNHIVLVADKVPEAVSFTISPDIFCAEHDAVVEIPLHVKVPDELLIDLIVVGAKSTQSSTKETEIEFQALEFTVKVTFMSLSSFSFFPSILSEFFTFND